MKAGGEKGGGIESRVFRARGRKKTKTPGGWKGKQRRETSINTERDMVVTFVVAEKGVNFTTTPQRGTRKIKESTVFQGKGKV